MSDTELTLKNEKPKYVLALDIGTTTTRCHVFDQYSNIKGVSSRKTKVLYPEPGHVEIDENGLWKDVIHVMKDSIKAAGLQPSDISCLGISALRNTFLLWDRETGKPLHHFITWKDHRATKLVESWNKSFTLKGFNSGSKFLHTFTRQKRYLSASILRFSLDQVSIRLSYMIENHAKIKQRMLDGMVAYGTIDTWLLWKLTGGEVFVTDYSHASSSGLFDPFLLTWSSVLCGMLGIPMSIFPTVVDTSGDIGFMKPDILGWPIQITSSVGDQQAAMFGQCCFEKGDVKCTLGSGTFIDLNTGSTAHASIAGIYPLVGWKIGSELVYIAEGGSHDTAVCIEWAQSLGLFEHIEDTSDFVQTVKDSGKVFFVPAFSGLQAPINDDTAGCLLIGLTPKTTKAHILRAILDAITFRAKMVYETMLKETDIPVTCLRVDGGVSNNDFIVNLLSSLVDHNIQRPNDTNMSSRGAAFLAGLAGGVWKNKAELLTLQKFDGEFKPNHDLYKEYRPIIIDWERAVRRSMNWYKFGETVRPRIDASSHPDGFKPETGHSEF